MSTQLATLGPLCQAAIITFKPFTHFFLMTSFFIVFALLTKLLASLLKTKQHILHYQKNNKLSTAARKLAAKHNFPDTHLSVLNSEKLIAFSSVLPGVANGIFLSEGIFKHLTQQQQEAVFLHEFYHWQSKQTVGQLVLKLFADVFFFIPILKDLLEHWLLQSELAADSFASTTLKSSEPLKQALTKWLSQDQHKLAWTVSFSETQLETRIRVLNKQRFQSKKILGISSKSLLVSMLVIGCFIFLGASDYSSAEATLIIPTNSQCTGLWQQQQNQSQVDAIMSPKSAE